MSFLYASLIAGPLALLIGVPALIHLINLLRHRRVRWAAMQFLVQSQKKHRTWILLRQVLLLLLRTAAIAVLLIMLAQPVLRSTWARLLGGVRTDHIFLLDDSFSMSDHGGDGSALAAGKRFVQRLADQLERQEGEHRLTLLRFSRAADSDEDGMFDILQEPVDGSCRSKLARILAAAQPSQTAAGPVAALAAVGRLPPAARDRTRLVYVVSDFRANQWGDAAAARSALQQVCRSGAKIHLVGCVRQTRDNLAITGLGPAPGTVAAGIEILMKVTVHNFGVAPARRVVVRLEQDGSARPAVVLDEIGPGSTATGLFRVNFPDAGRHTITAAIGEDPVAADNTRFRVLDLPEAVDVLLIDGSRRRRDAHYLATALAPDGGANTGLRPRIEAPAFLRDAVRLARFATVFLLNLDHLDDGQVAAVERYVRSGHGVAFFLGERTRGTFFNEKLYRHGKGLFPVPLTFPTDLLVNRLEKTPDLVVTDHPMFAVFAGARNSFLSSVLVERYFAVPAGWKPPPNSSTRVIARLRNGAPFVVEARFGQGRVVAVLSKAAPEETSSGRWNNWARNNPSFVVAMLELQAYLSARGRSDSDHRVGRPLAIAVDAQQFERRVRFRPPGQAGGGIVVSAVPTGGALRAVLKDTGVSGIYEAELRRHDKTLDRRFFAYNVSTREGDLQRVTGAELTTRLKGIPHTFHQARDLQFGVSDLGGVNLSNPLLALLAGLLLVEQVVAYMTSYHVPSAGVGR